MYSCMPNIQVLKGKGNVFMHAQYTSTLSLAAAVFINVAIMSRDAINVLLGGGVRVSKVLLSL